MQIDTLRSDFQANPQWRLSQNAITQVGIDDVALNRDIVTSTDYAFSTLLDDWKVTNQKQSGRCWMFAALNLFRVGAMKEMNLKNFEFSQNYTLFWDKFERANWFLEAIIETADHDIDDRTVGFLLDRPVDDGGQWNMFVNIVRKHGLVPKSVMPESKSSSGTARMNGILVWYLRSYAKSASRHPGRWGIGRSRSRDQGGPDGRDLADPLHALGHAAHGIQLAMERQGP